MYVLSQLLSAILACLTLRVLFNYQEDLIPMTTQYSDPTTDLEAIAWEFIITFFLMFVICGAADDDRAVRFFLFCANMHSFYSLIEHSVSEFH